MKLWIFVLLGLLAQTSHGNVSCSYESLEKSLTEKFTSAIHGCKGSSFFIPVLSLTNLKVEILDIVSAAVTAKHIGGGQFQVKISVSISTGCKGFSNTLLNVQISLTISHGLKNGNPCHDIVKDSLKVSITTNGDTKVLNLSLGGLVGGLVGSLTNLVTSLVSSLISLLTGTLTLTLESALKELNDELKSLTRTAGNVHCTVTNIEYGLSGVVYVLTYTVIATGETIVSTASQAIAALGTGVTSALHFDKDVINFIIKGSFTSYTKTIKGDILHRLNLFLGVEGDFDIAVTTPSASHCTTSSEGAVQTVTLGVDLNNIFRSLEFDVIFDLHFAVKRSKGQFKIVISDSKLVTVTVKSRHASCGCDDDDSLIDSITDIILELINNIVSGLKCEHEHNPIFAIPYGGHSEDEDYECPCDNSGISC